MKYELSEQFIKEAHSSACDTWKRKIESELPDLFKSKLDVGKWYKRNEWLFCFTENRNNDICGFGFDTEMNEWFYDDQIFSESRSLECIPATNEEVKEALIAEAKRQNIEGNKIVLIAGLVGESSNYKLENGRFEYNPYANELNYSMAKAEYTVFKNGKWATIIEQPKEYTMDELKNIVGHDFKLKTA